MKTTAITLTSLTFALLLSETDLSSDLLLFFLVGAIPGTDYSLSSGTMLTLISLATALFMYYLTRTYGLLGQASRVLVKTYHTTKEQLVKHSLGRA